MLINFVKKGNAHGFSITYAIKTVDPSLERYLIVDLKKETVCRPWSL